MIEDDLIYDSALRGLPLLVAYSERACLEGGPSTVAEATQVAASAIADILHFVSLMEPNETIPLGEDDPRLVPEMADGITRGYLTITRAMDIYESEVRK